MKLSDEPYAELRARILDGRLKAGTALKERDLCEELHVSRTPIREALRQLGAEGLAEIRPGRSIIVSSFDHEEELEIFALGTLLESFVAGLAAEKATADDIAELRHIVDAMEAALAGTPPMSDHPSDYVRLDQAFHERLSAMARSKRVTQLLRQTVSFRVLINVFRAYENVDFATSLAQHKTILRAIEIGDAEWASASMRSHIMTGKSVRTRPKPMPAY